MKWTGVEEYTVPGELSRRPVEPCGLTRPLQSSLFLDTESSAPCRAVASEGPCELPAKWRDPGASRREQRRAEQSAARALEGHKLVVTVFKAAVTVSPSEGRAAARLVQQRQTLSSHTLTAKMYFRETCKFFCTVLIICSILPCRNHCDMSSIK